LNLFLNDFHTNHAKFSLISKLMDQNLKQFNVSAPLLDKNLPILSHTSQLNANRAWLRIEISIVCIHLPTPILVHAENRARCGVRQINSSESAQTLGAKYTFSPRPIHPLVPRVANTPWRCLRLDTRCAEYKNTC